MKHADRKEDRTICLFNVSVTHIHIPKRKRNFIRQVTLSLFCLFLASGIIDILFKPRLEKSFLSFIDKVHLK